MSPLAAQANRAERTTNSPQKTQGFPSVPVATQDRLLQSTQSLLEALPQGSIRLQPYAAGCVTPTLPSSSAAASDVLGKPTANGKAPVTTAAPLRSPNGGPSRQTGRQGQRGTRGIRRHGAPPSSRSVARLRAVLRRLGATAQANGSRLRICLTAQGLARAKATLLKIRCAQQAPGEGVTAAMAAPGRPTPQRPASGSRAKVTSLGNNKPGGQKPESRGSGQPQSAAVASHPSHQTETGQANKARPAATEARASSPAAATKASQGAKKRSRPAAQSLRAGGKGLYTEDSIRVYLQEIGRIRLLRPDEEIELARKIADLLYLEQEAETYFHENERYPSMSEWAEQVAMPYRSFKRRLKLGRRAKEKMVQSNLRLVVSIAKKYMNRGLSFQDLIQEGSLGLVRAAEKFDHEKGYKFSTYATWWIRQAITRAIADQSRTIRLPVHLYETISRIKKSTKTLSQELGRKPSEEEIAERMEMTIEKLRFIAKSAQLPISLETPVGKEEDSRLGDFIESGTENPDQDVAKNLLREDLESVLATLNPRERDVLRLRYGLDDGRMKTLEDIGHIFEVTRERIRQIEAKALRKLRHPNRNGVLKEYIR